MGEELMTAAAAAVEKGLSPSRMRDLIAEAGVQARSRQPGRAGANLYVAAELRALAPQRQGARNDIAGDRLGELLAAAEVVAQIAGRVSVWEGLFEAVLAGGPAAVPRMVVQVNDWAHRLPGDRGAGAGPAARAKEAAEQVTLLFRELDELTGHLPMALRSRATTAYHRYRAADPGAANAAPGAEQP